MIATPLSIEIETVAQWVWRTSLEASLLITVVFLIGWAAGRKLPPRWRYVLGLLILARLVLPITLPGAWGFNRLVPDDISEPRWTQGYNNLGHSHHEVIPAPVIVEPPTVPEQLPADAPRRRGSSWSLSGFWAAGVLLVFGATVARMIRFTIRIRGAVPAVRADSLELLDDCRASLGVTRAIALLEMEGLGTPALYGVIRPRLLLPQGFLDRLSPQEVRLVFLHELAHLKAHDILLNWLIAMAGAIHWFNPVIWVALRRLRQDREILRDAQVLHRLDPAERATYGQTLLKLSEQLSGGVPCPSFIPVINHRSQITRRIVMITRYRKESRASNIGLAAVITVLALLTFNGTGSGLAVEVTPRLNAAAQRSFTTESRITFDEMSGHYMVVAKVSEIIAAQGETLEKVIAAPRMTVVAGKGGRITSTQSDGTVVTSELSWPKDGSHEPAAFAVTLQSGDTVLTESKFEFQLPGVPGQMASSQSSQHLRTTMAIARSVIIPSFKVEEATFLEAFRELIAAEKQNKNEDRHIDLRLVRPEGARGIEDLRVTLDLENVSIAEVAAELARVGDFELQEVNDWERNSWGLIFIPHLATPRFEPGNTIKTLQDQFDRLQGIDGELGIHIFRIIGIDSVGFLAAQMKRTDSAAIRAVSALKQMGPEFTGCQIGLDALILALEHPDSNVRSIAAGALGDLGTPAKAAVPALIEYVSKGANTSGVWALGRIGPDAKAALPILESKMRQESGRGRVSAAGAVWRVGGENAEARMVVMKALEDPDSHIRTAAGNVLVESPEIRSP